MRRIIPLNKRALIGLALAGLLLAACQTPAAPAVSAGDNAPASIPVDSGQTTKVMAQAQATALPTRAVAVVKSIAVDGALALGSPLVKLSFENSGKVTAVHVTPGQRVRAGDVLAELDGATLATALEQAQEQLALKQAQIEKSLAPTDEADIEAAKTALTSAYATYNALKKGVDSTAAEQALRSWNQAKNSLYSSQIQRDLECGFDLMHKPDEETSKIARLDLDCKVADYGVQSAELRERSAYLQYVDAQAPATQEELLKAWSNVAQAQANVASLEKGVSAEQKQVYALQLEQARLTVERAERDMAQTKLIAPCDGVVQEVGLSVGASASGSIVLLDTAQLRFHTSNLTELDVVKLKAGMPVTLRLKAVTQTLTGKVETILPMTSGTAGTAALYIAVIALDPTDALLLPGMTGQADIRLE